MKEDKDDCEELWVRTGPPDRHLEEMFGAAYMDFPDTSAEVDPDLKEAAEKAGGVIYNITDLYARAIEQAPTITCDQNQLPLAKHLRGFMRDGVSEVSFGEIHMTTKHRESCANSVCLRFDAIAMEDQFLTPQEMRTLYGELIDTWFAEHNDGVDVSNNSC